MITNDPNNIMDTNDAFILAVASYFGVPVDQVMAGSGVETAQGAFTVVLRVALTPDDIKGVASRMEALAEVDDPRPGDDEKITIQPTPTIVITPQQLNESLLVRMRNEYNALSHIARARFGSLEGYVKWSFGLDPYAAVDNPVAMPSPGRMGAAPADQMRAGYVDRTVAATERLAASPMLGEVRDLVRRAKGQAEYVFKGESRVAVQAIEYLWAVIDAELSRMAATERLTGADGKPTSNAPDFGGLPG